MCPAQRSNLSTAESRPILTKFPSLWSFHVHFSLARRRWTRGAANVSEARSKSRSSQRTRVLSPACHPSTRQYRRNLNEVRPETRIVTTGNQSTDKPLPIVSDALGVMASIPGCFFFANIIGSGSSAVWWCVAIDDSNKLHLKLATCFSIQFKGKKKGIIHIF